MALSATNMIHLTNIINAHNFLFYSANYFDVVNTFWQYFNVFTIFETFNHFKMVGYLKTI